MQYFGALISPELIEIAFVLTKAEPQSTFMALISVIGLSMP